jgi:hypothetical protein
MGTTARVGNDNGKQLAENFAVVSGDFVKG